MRLHDVNKPRCPECAAIVPENLLRSFWDNKRIKCDQCGKYFTAITDTFFSGCHFDFKEIVLFFLLLALDVHDKIIADIMKTSMENIRLWRLKLEKKDN
jgi:hypothetical protein